MKVEFHRQNRYFKDAHGDRLDAPAPPRFVLRLEAETEHDEATLNIMFGPFVTNPPILHLEFSAGELIRYDEPQPCQTQEEMNFKSTYTRPGR